MLSVTDLFFLQDFYRPNPTSFIHFRLTTIKTILKHIDEELPILLRYAMSKCGQKFKNETELMDHSRRAHSA
jgi:hypothetical protein